MRAKPYHVPVGLTALCLTLLLLAGACGPRLPDVPDQRTARIQLETVVPVPGGTGNLRIWVPLPPEGPFQSVEDLKIDGPGEPSIRREPKEGNRLAFFELEDPQEEEVRIEVSFLLTRRERDATARRPEHLSALALAVPVGVHAGLPGVGGNVSIAPDVLCPMHIHAEVSLLFAGRRRLRGWHADRPAGTLRSGHSGTERSG